MKYSSINFQRHTILVFFLIVNFFLIHAAKAETIHLTSLEWPPYIGSNLPDQGPNAVVVKQAFKAMGHDVKIDFFPWARAISYARSNNKYVGYFPEYYSKELEKEFIFSSPIGSGPLGLLENLKKPVAWEKIRDLSAYKIGVVRGYVNTKEFDQLKNQGIIKVDEAVDDIININKVDLQRIDAAIIDPLVFKYLITHENKDKKIIANPKTIQINSKLLGTNQLFVCLKKNEQGLRLSKILNQSLKKINISQINDEYFNKILGPDSSIKQPH